VTAIAPPTRHPLSVDFRDDDGAIIIDALMEIRQRTGDPADATLDPEGDTPAPAQIDVGADGYVTVWLPPGNYEFRGIRGADLSEWFPADIGEILGPVGPEGPAGPAGADGADGPAGADGPPGPPGPAGADGADGAQGGTGPQGIPGDPGPRARPARRAIRARRAIPARPAPTARQVRLVPTER
jgi:hypothetical protein